MKTANLNYRLVFILSVSIILASCVKFANNPETKTDELVIPNGFDWKTVEELTCTVSVNSVAGIGDNLLRIIRIYNSPLLNEGSLLASGSAKPSSPYTVKITLPTAAEKLYVQEIMPNGTRTVKTVTVSSKVLNISFSQVMTMGAPLIAKASPSPSITIPANYDEIINNNNSLELSGFKTGNGVYGNTYKSYLIPEGFTRTNTISFDNKNTHTILYVKGILRTSELIELNDASIVVLNGGRVEAGRIETKSSKEEVVTIYVEAGGTLITSNGMELSNGKSSVNKGTTTMSGDFTISDHSDFFNEGTLTVSKITPLKSIILSSLSFLYNSSTVVCDKIEINSNSSVLNDVGSTIDTKEWSQNTNTTTNNHGHITATTKFVSDSDAEVNNFCNITTDLADLKNSTYNLYEGSLFSSQSLIPYNLDMFMRGGSMFQTGSIDNTIHKMFVESTFATSYAVFKCTGNVPDFRPTNTAKFDGKIEMVHALLVEGSGANGRVLYESTFNNNGSILSKTQTKNIPATSCNDAAGVIDNPPTPTDDNDGDGVTNEFDVDDNDPTIAFVSYFPSANTWGTYAFEDLWPVKGDYDVNDLVLGFRIAYYTNSSNLVSVIRFDYNMHASGSIYNLGCAFQLDNVAASNVTSVTGQIVNGTSPFALISNGTESGVSSAVIPLFNNQKDVVSFGSFLNTESGSHVITPDKYVRVRFTVPFQQADITMSKFNLFIVVNTRGREVHLPTYLGTSKFDPMLASGSTMYPGDFFKYIDGMMWGLMLPEPFAYPAEYNSIVDTYLHFGEWATSGGTSFTDWYTQKPGYVNPSLIYQY
ncbi:MAG: hypothetical protein A2X18_06355 [Bacteroidetes bacterium GWF2_40_14]|nr:MAG: hypothetical protein A2X18_06355 [Bacteroidetes bacterium GWF2_40_14]